MCDFVCTVRVYVILCIKYVDRLLVIPQPILVPCLDIHRPARSLSLTSSVSWLSPTPYYLVRDSPLLTHPMGATSSPDPTIAPFESGMPRLVLRSAILSRGTLKGCRPLHTHPMGATSSPDPTIAPFESGMPRLVLRSAILLRGTLKGCRPLLTHPMGATSSPDPVITPLEPGMLRLALQPASLLRGIPTQSS